MIRLQIGLGFTAATLIFLTFSYAVWQWRADWLLAHHYSAPVSDLSQPNKITDLVASIPNEHLFGLMQSKLNNIPTTNLEFRVTGIVKVDTERGGPSSKAYISVAGAPSKIFQVGQTLPYGVKLYEISADAVVIENNGRLEKLPLPRQQLRFKSRQNETQA